MITETEIINYLQMSLQATNIRHSEQAIQKARLIQGFPTQLLFITDNVKYPIQLRQAALVNLKTTIDMYYQPRKLGDQCILQSDKGSLRDSILNALIRNCQQSKLVPLFCQIIYLMGYYDYPMKWQKILGQILQNIKNSSSFPVIYGSLLALKSIISIYSTELQQKRVNLIPIIYSSFGILQLLASKLFQNYNEKTGLILLVILKIFSSATYSALPEALKRSQTLHTWFIFLKKILDYKIDQNTPQILFKTKKKAIKIVYRFIQHHANPAYDKQFSNFFLNKYSVRFLQSLIFQILSPINNNSFKNQLLNNALASLPYLYKNDPNCRMLLDNYKQKIIPIILNGSILSLKDIQMWINDPIQFINKEKQSRKFIIDIIKMYPGCGSIVTKWLLKIMQTPGSSDVQRQIYLFVFSQLSNQVTDQIDASFLVKLLCNHIIPLMRHQSDLLKARSCEVFTSYADIILPQQIISVLISNIYECFISEIVPIKNHAAIAFSELLQHYTNLVQLIEPYITNILTNYIKLIQVVDNQEVLHSFKGIIAILSEKIQPYAIQLISSLSGIFFNYCEKQGIIVNLNDQQEQEHQFDQNAGDGCLAAIRQILNSELPQQCYKLLSQDLYKLITFILSEKSYNFLEEGLNILNLYLFKIEVIPNNFLTLFPLLCYMITNVPIQIYSLTQMDPIYRKMILNIADGADKDILENIIGSLRNYIAKMKSQLFSLKDIVGVNYIERIFQCIDFIQNSGQVTKIILISTLYITIIENNIGNIDNLISNILSFAITEIQKARDHNKLLLINMQIILMCFFYNSTLTLSLLHSRNLVNNILQIIIKNVLLFKTDYEKQRLVLGIIRVLEIGPNELSNAGININHITTFLHYLPGLAASIIECREKDSDNQSECSQAEQQQDENSHMFSINKPGKAQEQEQVAEKQWEQEYNKLYVSPLELFDEILYIRDFLKGNGYQYLQYLSNTDQEILSDSIRRAQQKKKNS